MWACQNDVELVQSEPSSQIWGDLNPQIIKDSNELQTNEEKKNSNETIPITDNK